MPNTAETTGTETLAQSHIAEIKALKDKTPCVALPAMVACSEFTLVHSMAMRREVRDTTQAVKDLGTRVDDVHKALQVLPDTIIAKANGNADRVTLGLRGMKITATVPNIARLAAVIMLIAILGLMVMQQLEKMGFIDLGSEKMIVQAVHAGLAKLPVAPPTE